MAKAERNIIAYAPEVSKLPMIAMSTICDRVDLVYALNEIYELRLQCYPDIIEVVVPQGSRSRKNPRTIDCYHYEYNDYGTNMIYHLVNISFADSASIKPLDYVNNVMFIEGPDLNQRLYHIFTQLITRRPLPTVVADVVSIHREQRRQDLVYQGLKPNGVTFYQLNDKDSPLNYYGNPATVTLQHDLFSDPVTTGGRDDTAARFDFMQQLQTNIIDAILCAKSLDNMYFAPQATNTTIENESLAVEEGLDYTIFSLHSATDKAEP